MLACGRAELAVRKMTVKMNLFIWIRRIPPRLLDLHRQAESRGDKVLIFGSVLFLTAECICEIMELLFFSFRNKRVYLAIKILDILYSVNNLASNFLEAFCLMKLIAIKDSFLKELSAILPFIATCCTILNLTDFAMTYFYIETEKHHLKVYRPLLLCSILQNVDTYRKKKGSSYRKSYRTFRASGWEIGI
uniref:G_PROTEIN_RECEP_F1_2 domain-containing protein n=1 Tax=Meloidogyne hapla TaxID=6305 RepID=A0A1I8BKT1_MELHA